MNILITGGGTEEPIDNVRSICNFSTGKTVAFLASALCKSGHNVTALMSERSVKPEISDSLKLIPFKSFQNLYEVIEKLCKEQKFDLIIHAAAVSDFSVDTIQLGDKVYKPGEISKISSDVAPLIKLKRNPKILDNIKTWCGANSKNTTLVAFKLTSDASENERKAAVDKVFDSTGRADLSPDYVVSNDLSEITQTAHPCKIWKKDGTVACDTNTLDELADFLGRL